VSALHPHFVYSHIAVESDICRRMADVGHQGPRYTNLKGRGGPWEVNQSHCCCFVRKMKCQALVRALPVALVALSRLLLVWVLAVSSAASVW
jgi:hypothetical protein